LVSPWYTAVIAELFPAGRVTVASVATPLVIVLVPSAVEPFMKVTVPVGEVDPAVVGETVAVKVTLCPKIEVVGAAVSAVVVVAAATVTATTGDVLDVNVLSPEY
jgi:hypothetical protein